MNQNKVYFISGVSGVGKTSVLKELKKLLPANTYDLRDFDERGVPDGGGQQWHDGETRHWLNVAASNAEINKSTIISGFINPDQFQKVYNPSKDISAQIILLDASPDSIRQRLYDRHSSESTRLEIERAAGIPLNDFVQQCATYAAELHSIFQRHKLTIVDTDNKVPATVAQEVAQMIPGSIPS